MTLIQLYAEHCKTACEWCAKGNHSRIVADPCPRIDYATCTALPFPEWCQRHVDALTQERDTARSEVVALTLQLAGLQTRHLRSSDALPTDNVMGMRLD